MHKICEQIRGYVVMLIQMEGEFYGNGIEFQFRTPYRSRTPWD